MGAIIRVKNTQMCFKTKHQTDSSGGVLMKIISWFCFYYFILDFAFGHKACVKVSIFVFIIPLLVIQLFTKPMLLCTGSRGSLTCCVYSCLVFLSR